MTRVIGATRYAILIRDVSSEAAFGTHVCLCFDDTNMKHMLIIHIPTRTLVILYTYIFMYVDRYLRQPEDPDCQNGEGPRLV